MSPSYHDITAAHHRIQPMIIKTPLLTSERLNDKLGFRLFLKAEPLQRTGSFKFRGACNAIVSLPEEMRSVIAFSSGNHAQAVALVARLTGRKATIIMPKDAPKAKIEGTKAYGANVILYDRYTESREEIGAQLSQETGAVLIKPYDDEAVISGQGTIGIELADQIKDQHITPHQILCCAGGGGLISGLSIAIKHHHPNTDIFSAEPSGFDDIKRSLATGEIEKNDPDARSICDAIVTPQPGEMTFPIMKRHLTGGHVVSDDDCLRAMNSCWRYLKIVTEPGGVVAFAAALQQSQSSDLKGKDVIAIASGGNCDIDLFGRALSLSDAI